MHASILIFSALVSEMTPTELLYVCASQASLNKFFRAYHDQRPFHQISDIKSPKIEKFFDDQAVNENMNRAYMVYFNTTTIFLGITSDLRWDAA